MKSVLRELRHAGEMPGYFDGDLDDPKSARIFRERARRARTIHAEQEAWLREDLRPYLLDRHHDAHVLGFERSKDRLTLTVEDADLNTLAGARYGFEHSAPSCTFRIEFDRVAYAGPRRAGDDDRLTWAPTPNAPVQWLFARFLDLDSPGFRWILNYDPEDGRDETGFLLVEAAEIRVIPHPREAWIAAYGAHSGRLFDRYAAVRGEMSLSFEPNRMNDLGVDWPPRER